MPLPPSSPPTPKSRSRFFSRQEVPLSPCPLPLRLSYPLVLLLDKRLGMLSVMIQRSCVCGFAKGRDVSFVVSVPTLWTLRSRLSYGCVFVCVCTTVSVRVCPLRAATGGIHQRFSNMSGSWLYVGSFFCDLSLPPGFLPVPPQSPQSRLFSFFPVISAQTQLGDSPSVDRVEREGGEKRSPCSEND